MKNFADLSKAQKNFVSRVLDVCPEYAEMKDLTWKQLLTAYFLLKEQRDVTGEKLGFPMWLQKTNIVSSGTYQMPWPNAQEKTEWEAAKNTPKSVIAPKKSASQATSARLQKIVDTSPVHDADVEDFNAILRENGIAV